MPELPDVHVYQECLTGKIVGHTLQEISLASVFVLRTAVPPLTQVNGRTVVAVRRIGKRIVLQLDGNLFVVLHLMIAGRLRWRPAAVQGQAQRRAPAVRNVIATLIFDNGALAFTEAGSRKRASMHIVEGEAALAALDPGGLEPLQADLEQFAERLQRENHTIKRALTDPHLFAGIGNAYSDEILHRARLSPFALTRKLDPASTERLFNATREVLTQWIRLLGTEVADTPFEFPEQVTAFHPEMAVHGRFRQPCPVCGAPVQRIVYADNETNYCARCQTGGVVLADRALSRLLKSNWPRSLEE
jgi:formamidopyrimidine-DNA glycosylase